MFFKVRDIIWHWRLRLLPTEPEMQESSGADESQDQGRIFPTGSLDFGPISKSKQ